MSDLKLDVAQQEPKAQAQVESNVSQIRPDATILQNNGENTDQKVQDGTETAAESDPNWRAFREARKRDRAEREAAEKRAAEKEKEVAALKAAMEAAFSAKQAPSTHAYQQYYGMNQDQTEETEEQRIERKVDELLSKKEELYKREQKEYELREYPNRLKKEYPDFGNVCSQENLDYLDYHYPEVSRPLQRLGEGYDKWSDIYHAVKKFIPNHSTAKKEAIRAEINGNKPRSISSSGPSPTGERPRETWQDAESRRAENWARMQRTLKGV